MLKLNGIVVDAGHFPDGTLLMKQGFLASNKALIDWRYESDEEIFALYCLTRHLQRHGYEVNLYMPYIPHARMDRVKGVEDVFTLKYFTEIINSLGFKMVTVVDPHSSVSEALINNLRIVDPAVYIARAIGKLICTTDLMLFYPDEGAMKRYSGMIKKPYAFGVKSRDWQTGKILSLEVMGEKENIKGRDVLIVDDICSKGGTFYYAAKALKALGAKKIYLYVTHCENTILEGELLTSGLIQKVFTTNSICTVEHEKVEVFDL